MFREKCQSAEISISVDRLGGRPPQPARQTAIRSRKQ